MICESWPSYALRYNLALDVDLFKHINSHQKGHHVSAKPDTTTLRLPGLFICSSICLVRETQQEQGDRPLPESLPFSWTDGPESRTHRSRNTKQDADGQLTQAIGLHVPGVEQCHRQLLKQPPHRGCADSSGQELTAGMGITAGK